MSLVMFQVSCKVAISKDGEAFLTLENIQLLIEIGETGSLMAAARSRQISYMKAWTMVTMLNKTSKYPVVLMQRGGHQGGGAELSEYGRRLLADYLQVEKQVGNLLAQINMELSL